MGQRRLKGGQREAKEGLTEAKMWRMHAASMEVVCYTHNEMPRWTLAAKKKKRAYPQGYYHLRRRYMPASVHKAAEQYGRYRREKIKDAIIAGPTTAARLKAAKAANETTAWAIPLNHAPHMTPEDDIQIDSPVYLRRRPRQRLRPHRTIAAT